MCFVELSLHLTSCRPQMLLIGKVSCVLCMFQMTNTELSMHILIFKKLVVYLKGREAKRVRLPIDWWNPQMSTTARAGPGWSTSSPGFSLGPLPEIQGPKYVSHCLLTPKVYMNSKLEWKLDPELKPRHSNMRGKCPASSSLCQIPTQHILIVRL